MAEAAREVSFALRRAACTSPPMPSFASRKELSCASFRMSGRVLLRQAATRPVMSRGGAPGLVQRSVTSLPNASRSMRVIRAQPQNPSLVKASPTKVSSPQSRWTPIPNDAYVPTVSAMASARGKRTPS